MIKKSLKVLIIMMISMLTVLLMSNISNAANWHGDGKFVNNSKYGKSLYGIYLTMRDNANEWIKSEAYSIDKVETGWGGEGSNYGESRYTSNGIIRNLGALCFGHAQKTSGNSSKIRTINIDYDSSNEELKLAALVKKSIDNNEQNNTSPYKNKIRRWLYTNSKDYGITAQTKDSSSEYNSDSEVKNYVKAISNVRFGIKGLTTTGTTLLSESDNTTWTSIGPIKVKADNNHPISFTIKTNDNKTATITHYSAENNLDNIRAISTCTTNGAYKRIYLLIKGDYNNNVSQITATQKEFTYYRAKVVMSQPTAAGGQNICIFNGMEEKHSNSDTIKVKEENYSIEIIKADEEDYQFNNELDVTGDLGKTLNGAGFIIRTVGTNWKYMNNNGVFVDGYNDSRWASKAKVFTTGSGNNKKGRVVIDNLEPNKQYILYEIKSPDGNYRKLSTANVTGNDIIRVSTFSNEQGKYLTDNNDRMYARPDGALGDKHWYMRSKNGSGVTYIQELTEDESTITVLNRKNAIDISGNVWEDGISGKGSNRDSIYDNGIVDKELQNVTVKLMNGNTVAKTTTTNENGYYEFTDIEIDKLSNYYVLFEYNGMSYESISYVNYTQSNTSKASESNRSEFNNKYQKIEKDYASGSSGNINLYYNKIGTQKSELKYGNNPLYGYSGAKYPINGVYSNFIITAKTPSLQELLNINPNAIQEGSMDNINLGLCIREQPDLAIINDVKDLRLQLNEYEHTYKYSRKALELNNDQFLSGLNINNINQLDDITNSTNKDNPPYTRDIYKSDITYENYKDNSLNVYITHRLTLINQSTTITETINELYNYYDSNYDISKIYLADKNGDSKTDLSYDEKNNQSGYKNISIKDITINPLEAKYIYIEYKVKREALIKLPTNQEKEFSTIAEVVSYSSKKDNAVYAGVDKDSQPNNYFSDNMYEDDTDNGSIKLIAKQNRVLSGTVWEDNAIGELLSKSGIEKERKGNGIYDANENIINNVKVELLDENMNIMKLYDYTNGTFNISNASTITGNGGSPGTYSFAGVIPGKYYIKYTYGNDSIIKDMKNNTEKKIESVRNYKSTIFRGGNNIDANDSNNWYWYREDTEKYSDAKDVVGIYEDGSRNEDFVETRNTSIDINYGKALEEERLTDIEAVTALFNVKIDDDSDNNTSKHNSTIGISEWSNNPTKEHIFRNIDLGIIERPQQDLEVKKEISKVEVILANGQAIISGDPRTDKIEHLRFLPDGRVYIEIDNELVQGATLKVEYEIKAINNCEVDYNDVDYYYYGIVPNANKVATATITQLYDYPSNEIKFLSEDQEDRDAWKEIKVNENLFTNGFLSKETYDAMKKYDTVLTTEMFNDMKPGDNRSVKMKLSRILSTTSDDLNIGNDIEVIALKDRTMKDSTPGNYIPAGDSTHERDDANANVIVTGPTGEDMNYVYYVIIGVLSLIILATGTILIKKMVLGKR